MKNINEEELLELFRQFENNKEKSYQKIYEKYYKLIYSIAFSIVRKQEIAEDIMQSVFLKLWNLPINQLPTVKPASWLYTITKNETLLYMRKIKPTICLEEIYEIEQEDSLLKEMMDQQAYQKLISRLNEEERQIVSLKILADLPFREISRLLEMPIGTVQWKYYKALHSLKLFLSNLSMFIITTFISVTMWWKKSKKGNSQIQLEMNEEEKEEEKVEEDTKSEEKQESTLNQKINIEEQNTDIIEQEEIIEINQEPFYKEPIIGMISLSVIFLVLTVFFGIILTKHKKK